MKKWLTSIVLLLAVALLASEAKAQRPGVNPNARQGTAGFGNPYFGGAYGPFGPALGGTFYGPILGNPGFQPGMNTIGGGPVMNPTGMGTGNAGDTTGFQAPLSSNITGHPTAFNTYSQYFNNQGGAFNTNTMTNAQQPTTANGNARRFGGVGIRPPQGRTNTAKQ